MKKYMFVAIMTLGAYMTPKAETLDSLIKLIKNDSSQSYNGAYFFIYKLSADKKQNLLFEIKSALKKEQDTLALLEPDWHKANNDLIKADSILENFGTKILWKRFKIPADSVKKLFDFNQDQDISENPKLFRMFLDFYAKMSKEEKEEFWVLYQKVIDEGNKSSRYTYLLIAKYKNISTLTVAQILTDSKSER